MKTRVLLFAGLRARVGAEAIDLDLPAGTPASGVFDHLGATPAEAARWRAVTRIAINMTYSAGTTLLREGDEVALIPPVAGG